MVEEIWATIVSEFSDVPDLSTITRITLCLVLAAILGGILGYERERKGRSAGVRTHSREARPYDACGTALRGGH